VSSGDRDSVHADDNLDKKEGKTRLFCRYNLGLYERFVLNDVLGFWYFQIPVPVRVSLVQCVVNQSLVAMVCGYIVINNASLCVCVQTIVEWVSSGDISVHVASRALAFMDSKVFLLLPIDDLLNQSWIISSRADKVVVVSEKGIALASLLLLVRNL
jgi:hypothetical protein